MDLIDNIDELHFYVFLSNCSLNLSFGVLKLLSAVAGVSSQPYAHNTQGIISFTLLPFPRPGTTFFLGLWELVCWLQDTPVLLPVGRPSAPRHLNLNS